MGCLRSWVGMPKRGGLQECPKCGPCKELVEHVLFQCASYDSKILIFWTI